MSPNRRLTFLCDDFILTALENETRAVNLSNSQTKHKLLRTNEVAREVLANWAAEKLLSQQSNGSLSKSAK